MASRTRRRAGVILRRLDGGVAKEATDTIHPSFLKAATQEGVVWYRVPQEVRYMLSRIGEPGATFAKHPCVRSDMADFFAGH
jgi:hypothetical protein